MDNKEEREIREYGIYGMRIRVPNPEKAAGWLCENLFFKREEDEGENAVISGKFHLILKEEKHTKYKTELENGYLGFTHIALETGDIGEAIRYCLERGMILELGEKGGARYSGKVYGTGMTYFNIKTEFGITFEVSQKLHIEQHRDKPLITGLEHIGLQTRNFDKSMQFYEELGFKKEFEPVINESDGVQIFCCMLSLGQDVVEIYEFHGKENMRTQVNPSLETLLIYGKGVKKKWIKGPSGENIEFLERGT